MTAETLPLAPARQEEFQTEHVLPIIGAHFVHDTYTAFIPALLPKLIETMSLTLTQAGSLNAISQIPGLVNPFIGYMADKVSLRYFVILAPAVTGTLVCSLGFASGFPALAVLFFIIGFSTACFHAPAPAMIGRVSGRKVGLGMSLFMAAGESGRTIGPLAAVWALSLWGLEGFYRVMVIGWASSLILYLRLRHVSARSEKGGNLGVITPYLFSLFLPLAAITLFRNFLLDSLTTYLPTYMSMNGANLWIAGGALSLLELAGVGGALTSGTLSDRVGRRAILLAATISSALVMLLFLSISGWLQAPVLLLLGFTALSATPVMLAMVQESLPNHRAVGNGLFMVISFALRPISTLAVGALGDHFGLHIVFVWSAWISLLAVPAILALPRYPKIAS